MKYISERELSQTTRSEPYRLRSREVPSTDLQFIARQVRFLRSLAKTPMIRPSGASAVAPRLSLLGLPAEIRNLIYDLGLKELSHKQQKDVLRTCRQIYFEARDIALRYSMFRINRVWQPHTFEPGNKDATNMLLKHCIPVVKRNRMQMISISDDLDMWPALELLLGADLQLTRIQVRRGILTSWVECWDLVLKMYGVVPDDPIHNSWEMGSRPQNSIDRLQARQPGKRLPLFEYLHPDFSSSEHYFRIFMARVYPTVPFAFNDDGEGSFSAVINAKRGTLVFRVTRLAR